MARSHYKSDRLKNSKSHEEVKTERHHIKQFLKEADLEELEELKDREIIRPVKEEGIGAPPVVKKIIRKDKYEEYE